MVNEGVIKRLKKRDKEEPYLKEIIKIAGGREDYDFAGFNKTVNDMFEKWDKGISYNDCVYELLDAGKEMLVPEIHPDSNFNKASKVFHYTIEKYTY